MSTLRFTPEHEWLRLEATGELTVGITTYAQEALGEYAEGNEVAVLESVKAASNISMPLNGSVVAVNQALADDPELVNASPMQDGWFFRIQVANIADLDTLMDQEGYERFLADNA